MANTGYLTITAPLSDASAAIGVIDDLREDIASGDAPDIPQRQWFLASALSDMADRPPISCIYEQGDDDPEDRRPYSFLVWGTQLHGSTDDDWQELRPLVRRLFRDGAVSSFNRIVITTSQEGYASCMVHTFWLESGQLHHLEARMPAGGWGGED